MAHSAALSPILQKVMSDHFHKFATSFRLLPTYNLTASPAQVNRSTGSARTIMPIIAEAGQKNFLDSLPKIVSIEMSKILKFVFGL